MSSLVALKGYAGFVISTDGIVLKYVKDATGKVTGRVKGTTRKMFQVDDGIVVVGLGDWNSYFPMYSAVARLSASRETKVNELRLRSAELSGARSYIFWNSQNGITCDIVENREVRLNQTGAVIYPEPALNEMFLALYESPAAIGIRQTGMLGMAALVNSYNLFAASLCSDISAPFDTILFTEEGIFNFAGGTTRLPVGDFR